MPDAVSYSMRCCNTTEVVNWFLVGLRWSCSKNRFVKTHIIINLCNIFLLQLRTNLDQRMTSLGQLETIYQGYQLFFLG